MNWTAIIPGPSMLYRIAAYGLLAASLAGTYAVFIHHERQIGRDEQRVVDQAENNKQKAAAAKLLAAETARAHAAEAAFADFKNQQEIVDALNRETSQAQGRRLVALGGPAGQLRDPYASRRGQGCGGAQGAVAASPGNSAADTADATGLLSKELSGFLIGKLAKADAINDAYSSCRADTLNVREQLK